MVGLSSRIVHRLSERLPVAAAHVRRYIKNGPRFRKSGELWCISDHTGTIHAPHINRYSLYLPTVAARINYMRERYPFSDLTGALVIDVGAHIGEYAIAAAQFAAKVISFEPDPVARKALMLNVASLPNVEVRDIALSNKNGTANFYIATPGADSSLYEPSAWSQVIEIQERRLDSLGIETSGYRSIFLKIDAEGFEPEVLKGGGDWLQNVTEAAIDVAPERDGQTTYADVKCFLERAELIERSFDIRAHVIWAVRK